MSLAGLSIAELGTLLRGNEITSAQIVAEAIDQIKKFDGAIHAFIDLDAEMAMQAARRADTELARGIDRGPLHGIPYALKDIYDVAGMATTCQSKLRQGHLADTDSAVASKLKQAGAVLLGKLATYEFAFGGPSFDLPFRPSCNPWNTDCITGGSSSGSAAAIAAGFVRFAPGSCTAGSIRGPAAWCGVVGLKPTYGRVSRRGVFPLAETLDHCGPLARSVDDAAIALQLMAGYDKEDPGSAPMSVPDFRLDLESGVKGLRIGVPRHFFEGHPGLIPDMAAAIDETIMRLRDAGAVVEDIRLPEYEIFDSCGRVIMTAEMYAVHKTNLRERLEDYGVSAMSRFVLGAAIGAADYINALQLRLFLKREVDSALERYDALLTAITMSTAPRFDPAPAALARVVQAIMFNVTGHPAMSVPVELGQDGLPLGVQIVGRAFDEATVLRIGRAIEASAPFRQYGSAPIDQAGVAGAAGRRA